VWDSARSRAAAHEHERAPNASPIAAAGVTAIKLWVAAIRRQAGVTGLCGRLSRRCGAPNRRSGGIQPAVVSPWGPGVPVAALVSWAVRWSLQRPHGRPAFGSGPRIIVMTSTPMVHDRSSSARRHGLWPVGSPPVRAVADNGAACGPSLLCSARSGDGYGRSRLRHRDGILR
jgi:hypothetical protein